jgi:hypothetical protein
MKAEAKVKDNFLQGLSLNRAQKSNVRMDVTALTTLW